jgi:hypothetical protein
MRVSNAKHTMIGVNFQPPASAAVEAPVSTATAQPASAMPKAVANANRTMVGVSLQSPANAAIAAVHSPVMAESSAASSGSVEADPLAKSAQKSPLAQAMVMPAAQMAQAMAQAQADQYKQQQGHSAPSASAVGHGGFRAERVSGPSSSADDIVVPGLRKNRGKSATNGALKVVLLLLGVSLVAGSAVLLLLAMRKQPEATLQAVFERGADGARVLAVRVPQAMHATTVSYNGHDYPVQNGAAHLPGSVVEDRVGKIVLPIQLLSNGERVPSTATVVIAYLVRPLLDGLGSEPPVARLQIRVQPGATLTLDGQRVQTDATGAGIAAIADVRPLLATDPPLRHNFAIRVQNPDQSVAEGQYSFELSRTALTLDRPFERTMTAASRAVIKVRAPGASAVLINDQPATGHEGDVFFSAVAVQSPTTLVNIRALRAQFAPALTAVAIDRIDDSPAGIARFAAASASPCAPMTNGAHVRLEGQVLGDARPRDGGSTVQLLVRASGCPGATPVWIDLEPEVSVRTGSSIRVFGTAVGTRTSVSTTGDRRTDPVILAAIVQASR